MSELTQGQASAEEADIKSFINGIKAMGMTLYVNPAHADALKKYGFFDADVFTVMAQIPTTAPVMPIVAPDPPHITHGPQRKGKGGKLKRW